MNPKLAALTIVAPFAWIALSGEPATAQIDTHRTVQRYNRVARGSNIAEWHRRLFDKNPHKRLEAVESLGKEGSEDCVKPLLDATADSDPRVRAKAFDYLGIIGSQRATQVLTQYLFLNDIDTASKRRILVALGRIADPVSVRPLVDFVEKAEDSKLRCGALYALGEVGEAGGLEIIRGYTESEDLHERRVARDAIAKINERVAAKPNTQPTILELEKLLGPRPK